MDTATLVALPLCLLATIFFSITDSALVHFTHAGLRLRAGDDRRFERLLPHLERRRHYQLVCYILDPVCDLLCVILLTQHLLAEAHTVDRVLAALGVSFLVVVVLGDVVPRTWGQGNADRWLVHFLPTMVWVARAAWPLTTLLRGVIAAVERLTGTRMAPVEIEMAAEVRSVVSEGEKRGDIAEGEKEMIASIFDLHDVQAAAIMTPRTNMVCIEAGAPLDQVAALAVQSGYSRIPVFERSRDNIVGVVHAKDLLKPGPAGRTARDVARPPYFVPEMKRVHELLHELRREQSHLAVVLDEYGGTAGLISLEDILEEIVGEIEDEYDEGATRPLRLVDLHTLECEGGLAITDLNGALGILLPAVEGVDTVGGFVSTQLGRIPAKGDSCTWRNVQFSVLDATERKVRRLRVTVQPEPEPTEGGEE